MNKFYLLLLGVLMAHLALNADEPIKHPVNAGVKSDQHQADKKVPRRYIGETEKNLSTSAKLKKKPIAQGQQDGILLFDEADAIKGKVKNESNSTKAKKRVK